MTSSSKMLAAILAVCATVVSGQHIYYHTTDSDNVHSNDTLVLSLADGISDSLRVTPGSRQQIELVFENKGRSGYFQFSGSSEDGLIGNVEPKNKYVERNQQVRLTLFDLEVPNDKVFVGKRLKYKVSVLATDLLRKRRSAEEAPEETYGRQDFEDANYEYNQNPPPKEEFPGRAELPYDGQAGSGGQSGGTFYPGGNNANANSRRGPSNPDPYRPPHVPQDQREISRTLLFAVVSEYDLSYQDTTSPYMAISYIAQTKEETCRAGPDNPACNREWWAAVFNVYDDGTGLKSVSIKLDDGTDPEHIYGGDMYTRHSYFYRYPNFPIGEVTEQKIIAGATCCHKSFTLMVSDVAGNKKTLMAFSSQYGTPWFTPTIMWIIIGVSILVLVIVISILVYCGWRKRWCYKEVSQGP